MSNAIDIVVNGGLMRSMRAHQRMVRAGAIFLAEVDTAPVYRLWSINDQFPGMIWSETLGASIAAELYSLPYEGFISVLESEPNGLCIGRVFLADGSTALGVLAEERLTAGMREITEHGGWRAYVEREKISQQAL